MSTSRKAFVPVAVCAATALLVALPGALRAQDGPAQTAVDNAFERASSDEGPSTLNSAQQARLKLSEAKRSYSQAEKYDQKAQAAKGDKDKQKYRDKAKEYFETAIADYKAALKLDPKLAEAWVGLAGLMVKSGHFDLAIQTYDKALELEPGNLDALAGKGHAELGGFKVADAQAIYEQIAAADKKAGRAFIADMRSWLEATRPRVGPEMADAVSQLDSWISEREK